MKSMTGGGVTVRCLATPRGGVARRARTVLSALTGIMALSISSYSFAQTTQPASESALESASQPTLQPTLQPTSRAPVHIRWQLRVLLDGEEVDSFSGDTAVGQSQTATHHRATSHPVGCEGAQTAPSDLSRTVSVSPLGVDSNNVIGFEISADDVIEDRTARAVQGTGCAIPPQTRTISARHPELDVVSGKTSDWILLKKQPQLIYRLSANVVATATP